MQKKKLFAILLLFQGLNSLEAVKTKIKVPNMYMRSCFLRDFFKQENTYLNLLEKTPIKDKVCSLILISLETDRISHHAGDKYSEILNSKADYDIKKHRFLEFITRDKYDLNQLRAPYRLPLLAEMILEQNDDAVKILIECGANVNQSLGKEGRTPLSLAALTGHISAVQQLKAHTYIDQMDNYGLTPLLLAASQGHTEIVELLLTSHANINACDHLGNTVLHLAANPETVRVALTALVNASKNSAGDADDTEIRLQRINKKSKDGKTPLHMALYKANAPLVKELLSAGANPNITFLDSIRIGQEAFPLEFATWINQVEIVKLLLQAGAPADTQSTVDGATALYLAASFGRMPIVHLLLDAHANTELSHQRRGTPLMNAVEHRNSEAVEALIAAGANIHTTDSNGLTPLHVAASHGKTKIVQILVENGADINGTDLHGLTPLHHAIQGNHSETIKLLVASGAKINITNAKGESLFRSAIKCCKPKEIALLYRALQNETAATRVAAKEVNEEEQVLVELQPQGEISEPSILPTIDSSRQTKRTRKVAGLAQADKKRQVHENQYPN